MACALEHTLSRRVAIMVHRCVEETMNGIIYLVGLVVVVLAILSFVGLR